MILKKLKNHQKNYSVELANPKDFQLNKFFYKNIGKNCQWVDRLIWTDLDWTNIFLMKNFLLTFLKIKMK